MIFNIAANMGSYKNAHKSLRLEGIEKEFRGIEGEISLRRVRGNNDRR